MSEISLINPNTYAISNYDIGQNIVNMFINQNNQLEMAWGYEVVESDFFEKEILATLVTASGEFLILVDIEGVLIAKANGEHKFQKLGDKLLFAKARNPKYNNKQPYRPNKDKFSIVEGQYGIIYITDGSIGGLYLLIFNSGTETSLATTVFFRQIDWEKIGNNAPAEFVKPFDPTTQMLIHCLNPCYVSSLNPFIAIVDNRDKLSGTLDKGYMYILTQIDVKQDGIFTVPNYDKVQLTIPYVEQYAIIACPVVNDMLYTVTSNTITPYQISSSTLPVLHITNSKIEIGCQFRNHLTVFNGKIILIASSDEKQYSLNVISGGSSNNKADREFNDNGLSYIFKYDGVNVTNLSLASFGTHSQEFCVISGFTNSTAVLVDITMDGRTSGFSYFLQDTNFDQFPIRNIFKFRDKVSQRDDYYFTSFDEKDIFLFSDKVSSYVGNQIVCIVKTPQFSTKKMTQHVVLQDLKVQLQSDLSDVFSIRSEKRRGYELPTTNKNVRFKIETNKFPPIGWYDGNWIEEINSITNSKIVFGVIQSDFKVQIRLTFFPKVYSVDSTNIFSRVIIDQLSLEALE